MAGPSKALVLDPALQKYQDYSKNRYKYFRWTPRNAWITLIYAAVIPISLGYVTYKTDVCAVSPGVGFIFGFLPSFYSVAAILGVLWIADVKFIGQIQPPREAETRQHS